MGRCSAHSAPESFTHRSRHCYILPNCFYTGAETCFRLVSYLSKGFVQTDIFLRVGLCDVAYATQRAFFLTPFVTIGLNPAGCSSLVFPQLLGNSRANRLMMLGERISAHEAKEFGLINDVFEDEMFEKKCEEKIDHVLTKLNIEGMMKVKALCFDEKRKLLKERNRIECEMFRDSFLSEQFKHKIAKMFKK